VVRAESKATHPMIRLREISMFTEARGEASPQGEA
jgi:prolyl-tRNA synthetase